jgi:hypothetical protein
MLQIKYIEGPVGEEKMSEEKRADKGESSSGKHEQRLCKGPVVGL